MEFREEAVWKSAIGVNGGQFAMNNLTEPMLMLPADSLDFHPEVCHQSLLYRLLKMITLNNTSRC